MELFHSPTWRLFTLWNYSTARPGVFLTYGIIPQPDLETFRLMNICQRSVLLSFPFKFRFLIDVFTENVVEIFVAEDFVNLCYVPLLDVCGVRVRQPEEAL